MADLDDVAALAATNGHLAIVSTLRADGGVQASLVNAGVTTHPVTGRKVLAFVAIGGGAKLANLRRRPSIAVTFQRDYQWITVEGTAELAGPDDTELGLTPRTARGVATDDLHRCGRNSRRLAHLRRDDGPGAARGGVDHPDPHLQQSG
jgi:hypothetical protein